MVNSAVQRFPALRRLARIVSPVVSAATGRWEKGRLPDLGELQRLSRFQDLDRAAAEWIDRNFHRIESAGSWLVRAGGTTLDSCRTGTSAQGVMHRGVFAVTCERSVSSVYGCAGDLEVRLDQLAGLLTAAGWRDSQGSAGTMGRTGISLAGREPPAQAAWHHRDPVSGLPADMIPGSARTAAPSIPAEARVVLAVGWGGGGDRADSVRRLITLGPEAEKATDYYRSSQVEHCNADELTAQVLAGHPNVIAIRMTVVYYHKGGIKWGASRGGWSHPSLVP